jgi:hypothetical protein
MPQTTAYGFIDQKTIGDKGEATLDKFFIDRGYKVEEVSKKEQKMGIDRYIINGLGIRTAVEYKTDTRTATTGNVFVETISNSKTGALGWAIKGQADFLLYYVPSWGKALLVDMGWVRNKVPEWIFQYKLRKILNKGYDSFGIPVPWNEFLVAGTVLNINDTVEETAEGVEAS